VALWQFDLHFLPRISVLRRYNAVPIRISRAEFDGFDWWHDAPNTAKLGSRIDVILPKAESWSPSIKKWGDEDGNRVDIVFKENSVEAVFVRIDVRDISVQFLSDICSIAAEWDCLFLLGNDLLMSASVSSLLAAMRQSKSFHFVTDPEGFLSLLARTGPG